MCDREAFEQWHKNVLYEITDHMRDSNGRYIAGSIQTRWETWKAAHSQGLDDALAKVREAREGQHKYHGWGEEFFEGFDAGIDDAALAVQSLISN